MSSKASKLPLISIIIIDYKINNPYLEECLKAIENQTFKNYETILITDYSTKIKSPRLIKHFFNGYTNPATKRDYGAKIAHGKYLAFIDDDAFPDKNWLKNIVKNFLDKNIAAVGGPGITPPRVSWQESASGWVSSSPLGAGPHIYRFLPMEKRFVDDYPSMNLSVRRDDFLSIGGFDSHYWPGEDTKLCLDLVYRGLRKSSASQAEDERSTKDFSSLARNLPSFRSGRFHKLKKKIIYDPKVIVYHHRRPLLLPHLKQNGNYGLHRGFFVKILPENSLKTIYFLPSLFPILVFSLPVTYYLFKLEIIIKIQLTFFLVYLLALFLNSIWIGVKSKSLFQAIISIPSIFLTHFWYGFKFIQGLIFTSHLKR
jgi:glycosyltransferase involved in cell wall biosynthesis